MTKSKEKFLFACVAIPTIFVVAFFLCTGCTRIQDPPLDKTQFYFKQEVLVKEGFYKGVKARIVKEGSSYSDCFRAYEVDFYDRDIGSWMQVTLCNSKLEAIK